jgi:hypothetical protein
MKKPWWAAALAALVILASGCHNGGHDQNSTQMRALNAVADAQPLDVLIDDDVKVPGLALGSTSAVSEFDSGTRDTKIRSSPNQAILVEKSIAFNGGAMNTLAIIGHRGAVNTMLLADDTTAPSSGKFKVRAAGLTPDAGAVDVYITSGDVADTVATISGLTYGAVTDYAEGTPGDFRITFTAAGTKEVLFQSALQTLSEGQAFSAAVFPSGGGKLVNAVLLINGATGSGTFLPNPLGRLKSVNAIPDAGLLNFQADGATLLANVPFAGSSSYVTLPSGSRAFQIEASNVPGSALASATQTIDPARDYTLLALGSAASAQLAAIADDNSLPNAGYAKLRFVNALSGSGPVDSFVNFASQATSVTLGTGSSYSQLLPGTTYDIAFATAGGVTTLAAIDPAELDAGGVYTAYLVGSAGNAQARLVRDR